MGPEPIVINVGFISPINGPSNWVTGIIFLLLGVVILFRPGGGAPCMYTAIYRNIYICITLYYKYGIDHNYPPVN